MNRRDAEDAKKISLDCWLARDSDVLAWGYLARYEEPSLAHRAGVGEWGTRGLGPCRWRRVRTQACRVRTPCVPEPCVPFQTPRDVARIVVRTECVPYGLLPAAARSFLKSSSPQCLPPKNPRSRFAL